MLLKILLTAGLIYIAYIAFFKKPTIKSPYEEKKPKKDDKVAIEEMIQCAHCGTYISQEDTILSMGKSFCSKECVEAAS